MTLHLTELDDEQFCVWVKVPGDEFHVGRITRERGRLGRRWFFDAVEHLPAWPATLRTWARAVDSMVHMRGFANLEEFEGTLP